MDEIQTAKRHIDSLHQLQPTPVDEETFDQFEHHILSYQRSAHHFNLHISTIPEQIDYIKSRVIHLRLFQFMVDFTFAFLSFGWIYAYLSPLLFTGYLIVIWKMHFEAMATKLVNATIGTMLNLFSGPVGGRRFVTYSIVGHAHSLVSVNTHIHSSLSQIEGEEFT